MVTGQNAMPHAGEEFKGEGELPNEELPMEADLVVDKALKLELVTVNPALVRLTAKQFEIAKTLI